MSCPLQKSSVVSFSGTSHGRPLPPASLAPTVPRSANLVCATHMDFDSRVSPAPCCRALLGFSASPRGTMRLVIRLSARVCRPSLWVSTSFCPIHVTLSLLSSLLAQTACACRLVSSANANHVHHPVGLRKSDITTKRSIKSSKNLNVSQVESIFLVVIRVQIEI